jgi:hypothetical protein
MLVGAAVLLFLISPAKATGFDDRMNALRWQARVLLVFSSGADDSRAQAMVEVTEEALCEMEARDLVVGHIPSSGEAYVGEVTLARGAAEAARSKYGIDPAEFRVLLIGKDGGLKSAYKEVPDLDDLFRLIDGMPMRRREARAGSTCQDRPNNESTGR